MDALIDRMQEAATEEAYPQAGHDLQRDVVAGMMDDRGVTTLPFLQAAQPSVKGDENPHGHTIRFETTWRDQSGCHSGRR